TTLYFPPGSDPAIPEGGPPPCPPAPALACPRKLSLPNVQVRDTRNAWFHAPGPRAELRPIVGVPAAGSKSKHPKPPTYFRFDAWHAAGAAPETSAGRAAGYPVS